MILSGNAVSEGYALGNAYLFRSSYNKAELAIFEGDSKIHKERFDEALKTAAVELEMLISGFDKSDDAGSAIFSAQLEVLYDEEILESIEFAITNEKKMPHCSVDEVFQRFIDLLSKVKDPLIAARTTDLSDVRNRLLRNLTGEEHQSLSGLQKPVIIVADDLLPSDTATLNRSCVLGIITQIGSETSHTAILANSYGIPAIVGVTGAAEIIKDGQELGMDAVAGKIYIEPDILQRDELEKKRKDAIEKNKRENMLLDKPGKTADGHCVEIGLNIGSTEESEQIVSADFIGLFRTEFLYMKSMYSPTEDEQFEVYKSVLEAAASKPVTLRTLDIGGDKTLPYLMLPKEQNPFMGKRALRLCFENNELFKNQLRAALRASASGQLWIMLPMVGSIDDICRARRIFDDIKNEMDESHVPYDRDVRFGIMIEIPSIAMIADIAVEYVDFASIGTNDLCQYFCAVDRMNPELAEYYQSYSPAMIRLLSTIADAFNASGKPLSVCGEMAGNEAGAALLAGMGISKLSMSGNKIGKIKAMLSRYTMSQLQDTVRQAKKLSTQDEVIKLLKSQLIIE